MAGRRTTAPAPGGTALGRLSLRWQPPRVSRPPPALSWEPTRPCGSSCLAPGRPQAGRVGRRRVGPLASQRPAQEGHLLCGESPRHIGSRTLQEPSGPQKTRILSRKPAGGSERSAAPEGKVGASGERQVQRHSPLVPTPCAPGGCPGRCGGEKRAPGHWAWGSAFPTLTCARGSERGVWSAEEPVLVPGRQTRVPILPLLTHAGPLR